MHVMRDLRIILSYLIKREKKHTELAIISIIKRLFYFRIHWNLNTLKSDWIWHWGKKNTITFISFCELLWFLKRFTMSLKHCSCFSFLTSFMCHSASWAAVWYKHLKHASNKNWGWYHLIVKIKSRFRIIPHSSKCFVQFTYCFNLFYCFKFSHTAIENFGLDIFF